MSKENPKVVALLKALNHPMKAEIEQLRTIILRLDPAVHEEVKWNAPSFRTTDHFATFHLRTQDVVRLILHTGAKSKAAAKAGLRIDDPQGLLHWLGPDRAALDLTTDMLRSQKKSVQALLRNWIENVPL